MNLDLYIHISTFMFFTDSLNLLSINKELLLSYKKLLIKAEKTRIVFRLLNSIQTNKMNYIRKIKFIKSIIIKYNIYDFVFYTCFGKG